MKTYPYNFTKTVKILLFVLCALCAVCIGYTCYRAVVSIKSNTITDFFGVLTIAVPFIVAVFGLVLAISMLKKSCYEINGRQFITRFGFLTSTYQIPDVTEIHLFTKTRKLAVYFKNNTYIVIAVKEEWYKDFIDELLKRNKSISYNESEEQTL